VPFDVIALSLIKTGKNIQFITINERTRWTHYVVNDWSETWSIRLLKPNDNINCDHIKRTQLLCIAAPLIIQLLFQKASGNGFALSSCFAKGIS
jgi:hypothetical protein